MRYRPLGRTGIVVSEFCLGAMMLGEWGNTDQGRHILIAVARYLAAHSPTERSSFQTADIAQRLLRGGELHLDT